MSIHGIQTRAGGTFRKDGIEARNDRATTRVRLDRVGVGDGLDKTETRQRGATVQGLDSGRAAADPHAAPADPGATSSLLDTTHTELAAASQHLDSVSSEPPKATSLPPGDLKVNPDGSITTPGGYTIYNDGSCQWRIKDPSGLETRIWGDPHVDEGNDGKDDWHFNKDGTFILGDGTKIFCDTADVGTDGQGHNVAVSHELKIQYLDSLGTLDLVNGGPGTVTGGGRAYDSENADGDIFVMGLDGKFYDGVSKGKLIDDDDDYAFDVDAAHTGRFSDLANVTRVQALFEAGILGPDGRMGLERLATLTQLENDAFLVNDRDGGATDAARRHAKLAEDKVLGQANQADKGFSSLAQLDVNGDGRLSGQELDGVKVWVDANHDGLVDNGELKLLAEFNVQELKVRVDVTQHDDGTTQLQGQFDRAGHVTTTDDRINPLNDRAQGTSFQRQLLADVGPAANRRAIAGDRLAQVSREIDRLRAEQQQGHELNRQIGHRQISANLTGTRA